MKDWGGGLIDNHCHLSDERVFQRSKKIAEESALGGVSVLVLAGTHPEEWARQLEVRSFFSGQTVLNFGLHPWWVEKFSDAEVERAMLALAKSIEKADGLGETGLDFGVKRNVARFTAQEFAFRKQLQLARTFRKPLVLHIVSAHERAVAILKEEKVDVPLVVHSYSGNVTQLEAYAPFDAYFSFSGTIVREQGYEKVKKALLRVPEDRLLFETDAPDQYWGEGENHPANVAEVYQAASRLRGEPMEQLVQRVAKNLKSVYKGKN